MNKKILSCALVAAMLASSVGAMGVSAANKDAFDNHYKTTGNAVDLQKTTDLSKIYVGDFEDAMDDGMSSDYLYLFNFVPEADVDQDEVSLDDVKDAIADAQASGDVTATLSENGNKDNTDYNTAIYKLSRYFYGKNPDNFDEEAYATATNWVVPGSLTVETGAKLANSDAHYNAVADLKANQKDIADNWDATFYDATELNKYGIYNVNDKENADVLINAVKNANLETVSTARAMYLNYEYDRLLGEDGLIAPSTTKEEQYEALLEKAENLTEDDYTASNWVKVQRQIELAEIEASAGTAKGYSNAITELNKIFTEIETVKPSYSDLQDALEGLYEKPSQMQDGIYTGKAADGCLYLKADYKYGNGYSDAWYEFAGKAATKDEDAIEGAYKKAYDVYELCKRASTRKYVAQSTVDKALEDLNNALLALDPNYETANWVTVMLEDALEQANAIVETDYRTTSSYWKTFVKDKEYVEKLLEQENVKETTAEAAVKALLGEKKDGKGGSIAALKNCKLSVPTDTKNALKDAMDEAKDLLEDKTGKTSAQIVALQTAYDAAKEINTSNTISEYENATTELNNAITNYKHPQGWYKGTDGLWYYGKEDKNATGWLNVNGVWYYLDATTGAMKTGWQQVNGTWYYLDASGAMKTGWLNLNGTYYYLESWGGMATGWKNVNGSWYYLQPSGAMLANGWYWINGKCYYFYNWGGMAANTTIGGYTVDASGAWVK